MHIVAIGGGDKEPIIRDAADHMPNPNVLIIPTACSTETSYNKKVSACVAFFDRIGLPSVVLHKLGETPNPTAQAEQYAKAGMLYVIGGHTPTLLKGLIEHGGNREIRGALDRNATLAGTSAGALLPFDLIHSNPARQPAKEPGWDYTYLEGLSVLRAAATAHGNAHDQTPNGPRPDSRMDHLQHTLPVNRVPLGLAIENGAALVVHDAVSMVGRSIADATIHLLTPSENGVVAGRIEDNDHLTMIMNTIVLPPTAPAARA